MEEARNLANIAFESFLAQDFKLCFETLNKLRNANTQNEKDVQRIKQNLYITEFVGGKNTAVNNLLSKLEDLFIEVKSTNPTSSKTDSSKPSGDLDEDLSGANIQENDENGILRYNYAVALQLAGKRHQSVPLLEEIFQNKESVDYYVLLKATLTHLELAILQKDYHTIKTILDYFETIDKYVGIARPTPLNLTSEGEEGSESSHADTADSSQADKEIKDYNSLIFGSEIPKSPQTANICKLEFNFILSIYQIHLLLSLKETDLAKRKIDSCQTTFHNFSKVIKDGRDDKGNLVGRFNPSISSFIDTHANILFSFAKAYYAYQTQSYAESMKLLNTIEILTFLDKEILAYTAFQLNNLGCCHLRMKKYNLAAYYLSKALSIIQKLSKETTGETKKYERLLNLNAVQHYPVILYNYALATLQMGKNEEAAEAYSSLAEFWPDNAKVWYRTALCHLNKSQEILSDNQGQKKERHLSSIIGCS